MGLRSDQPEGWTQSF